MIGQFRQWIQIKYVKSTFFFYLSFRKKTKEVNELEVRYSESKAPIFKNATESASTGSEPACRELKATSSKQPTKSRSEVPKPSSLEPKNANTGSRNSCRPELSPPPSRNSSVKIIEQNMDVDAENTLGDSEENFEDCEAVNLKQVLDNLKYVKYSGSFQRILIIH